MARILCLLATLTAFIILFDVDVVESRAAANKLAEDEDCLLGMVFNATQNSCVVRIPDDDDVDFNKPVGLGVVTDFPKRECKKDYIYVEKRNVCVHQSRFVSGSNNRRL
ncbi:uncharacterized protein LOC132200129 [Neocloeon triangulifer]|uniref:uncharacterized protein LOC132200129 n=1 Tax=Neocloeon triangulifer TaxID=2078957 RepID=UPI00286EE24E|nr:uncharacterized protein LOC132200129 [Neocloeon triangulifer]